MKNTDTQYWREPNTGATNESGFTGLPGGYRDDNGIFDLIRFNGYWWNSSNYNFNNAWSLKLGFDSNNFERDLKNKRNGYSVRCIQD